MKFLYKILGALLLAQLLNSCNTAQKQKAAIDSFTKIDSLLEVNLSPQDELNDKIFDAVNMVRADNYAVVDTTALSIALNKARAANAAFISQVTAINEIDDELKYKAILLQWFKEVGQLTDKDIPAAICVLSTPLPNRGDSAYQIIKPGYLQMRTTGARVQDLCNNVILKYKIDRVSSR
ncbi:MAG: hypothetical protein JWO06_213 [Bacteroidota bacterium]|nr:hypothetical protein [Bacteroidota bacterium]